MPVFDTERVWTFGFWQSQINFMTYRIDLGIGIFNLIRIMDGQPLCFCSSTRAGHILFRMEVWHRMKTIPTMSSTNASVTPLG